MNRKSEREKKRELQKKSTLNKWTYAANKIYLNHTRDPIYSYGPYIFGIIAFDKNERFHFSAQKVYF